MQLQPQATRWGRSSDAKNFNFMQIRSDSQLERRRELMWFFSFKLLQWASPVVETLTSDLTANPGDLLCEPSVTLITRVTKRVSSKLERLFCHKPSRRVYSMHKFWHHAQRFMWATNTYDKPHTLCKHIFGIHGPPLIKAADKSIIHIDMTSLSDQ